MPKKKKSFDEKFKFLKLAAQQAQRKTDSSGKKVNISRTGKNLHEFRAIMDQNKPEKDENK